MTPKGQIELATAQDEGEIDLTTPAKASRTNNQQTAHSTPNILALQAQLNGNPTQMQVPAHSYESSQPLPSPSPTSQWGQHGSIMINVDEQENETTPQQMPNQTGDTPPQQANNTRNAIEQPKRKKPQRSIKDRLTDLGEMKVTNKASSWDPLSKYTDAEMPKVHHTHPMKALSNIDLDLIGEWEDLSDSKLLAQPFGGYAANPGNHRILRALIFREVHEITKSN